MLSRRQSCSHSKKKTQNEQTSYAMLLLNEDKRNVRESIEIKKIKLNSLLQ
jgi:hypothetical protein